MLYWVTLKEFALQISRASFRCKQWEKYAYQRRIRRYSRRNCDATDSSFLPFLSPSQWGNSQHIFCAVNVINYAFRGQANNKKIFNRVSNPFFLFICTHAYVPLKHDVSKVKISVYKKCYFRVCLHILIFSHHYRFFNSEPQATGSVLAPIFRVHYYSCNLSLS